MTDLRENIYHKYVVLDYFIGSHEDLLKADLIRNGFESRF